jgi:hypothetical protein
MHHFLVNHTALQCWIDPIGCSPGRGVEANIGEGSTRCEYSCGAGGGIEDWWNARLVKRQLLRLKLGLENVHSSCYR